MVKMICRLPHCDAPAKADSARCPGYIFDRTAAAPGVAPPSPDSTGLQTLISPVTGIDLLVAYPPDDARRIYDYETAGDQDAADAARITAGPPPPDRAGLIAAAKTPTGRTEFRLTTLAPPVIIRPDPALPLVNICNDPALRELVSPEPATGKGVCPNDCGGQLCDGAGCPIANCCACDGGGADYPRVPDNCDADS